METYLVPMWVVECGVQRDGCISMVKAADAQATVEALQAIIKQMGEQAARLAKDGMAAKAQVEALQARVSELQGIADEKCRCFLERAEQSEKQLTQRAVELEAANKLIYKKNCELGRAETINNDLQAELGRVRADNKALDEWRADVTVSLQRPGGAFFVDVPQHIKDIVKERDALRTLILALPKVEGEIEVSSGVYNFILLKHDSGTRFLCGQIETEQTAKAIAALLQHRQGMEG